MLIYFSLRFYSISPESDRNDVWVVIYPALSFLSDLTNNEWVSRGQR